MTFKSKELQTLVAFQEALTARGRDYASVRDNQTAALLLDLRNASESGLLKKVVKDWGLLFSLWKVADAYLESVGERRKQMRELLKHLFFWADYSSERRKLPSNLNVLQNLFHHEGGLASATQRCRQAEALAARLVIALEKVTRELGLYSIVVKTSLRPSIRGMIKECDVALEEAEYLVLNAKRAKHWLFRMGYDEDDVSKAVGVTAKLANTLQKALNCLRDAVRMFRPTDAYRARHIIRASEAALLEVIPHPEPEPAYTPMTIMLFDAALYVSRLLIGFWLIPLVLALDSHLRSKEREAAQALAN